MLIISAVFIIIYLFILFNTFCGVQECSVLHDHLVHGDSEEASHFRD